MLYFSKFGAGGIFVLLCVLGVVPWVHTIIYHGQKTVFRNS